MHSRFPVTCPINGLRMWQELEFSAIILSLAFKMFIFELGVISVRIEFHTSSHDKGIYRIQCLIHMLYSVWHISNDNDPPPPF